MSARVLALVAAVTGAASACVGDAPIPVAIQAQGSTLVAIEDGGAWRVLAHDANGAIATDAVEPFTIVRVCEEPGVARWDARRSGAGAPAVWALDCPRPTTRVDVSVRVTGLIAPSDKVVIYIGDAQSLGGRLSVEPGVRDLIVVDVGETAGRIVIRRGVAIDGPTRLVVDFEREGAALSFRGLAGTDGDATRRSALRTVGGTSALFPAPRGPGFWLAPPELLIRGDQQSVAIDDGDPSSAYWVVQPIEAVVGAPVELAAPPEIDRLVLTAEGATWSYPAAWTVADLTGPTWTVRDHGRGRGDGALALPDVAAIPDWRWPAPGAFGARLLLTDLRAPDDFTIVARALD